MPPRCPRHNPGRFPMPIWTSAMANTWCCTRLVWFRRPFGKTVQFIVPCLSWWLIHDVYSHICDSPMRCGASLFTKAEIRKQQERRKQPKRKNWEKWDNREKHERLNHANHKATKTMKTRKTRGARKPRKRRNRGDYIAHNCLLHFQSLSASLSNFSVSQFLRVLGFLVFLVFSVCRFLISMHLIVLATTHKFLA